MKKIKPIGWFEIYINDFERAKNFYGELFGWEFQLSQGSRTLYWNINTGNGSLKGGFAKKSKSEHEGQSVILYVEVDSIEETINKAIKLGGKTETPKTLISESAGYFALIKDYDNNVIGVWSEK